MPFINYKPRSRFKVIRNTSNAYHQARTQAEFSVARASAPGDIIVMSSTNYINGRGQVIRFERVVGYPGFGDSGMWLADLEYVPCGCEDEVNRVIGCICNFRRIKKCE